MRTLDPAFIDAFERGRAVLSVLVEFTTPAGNAHRFAMAVQGDPLTVGVRTVRLVATTYGNGCHSSLLNLSVVDQSVHVWSRDASIGEITMTFANDEIMREILAAEFLKTSRCIIKWGDAELQESELDILVENAIVDDVTINADGTIEVHCGTMALYSTDFKYSAYHSPQPPTRIAEQLVTVALGLTTAIDTDSFNEELNHTDISHTLVSTMHYGYAGVARDPNMVVTSPEDQEYRVRVPYTRRTRTIAVRGSGTEISVRDQLTSLLRLIYGTIYPNEEGKWKLVRYDRAASAVKHIEAEDIADFHQLSMHEEPISVLDITGFGPPAPGSSTPAKDVIHVHKTSAASRDQFGFRPFGGAKLAYHVPETLSSPWLSHHCPLVVALEGDDIHTLLDDTYTTLRIKFPRYRGFSGTWQESGGSKLDPPSQYVATEHQVTASKPAWFLISNRFGDQEGGLREVVKATAMAFPVDTTRWQEIQTPLGPEKFWLFADYTIERGQRGTSPVDWAAQGNLNSIHVWDITLAVLLGDAILDRVKFGVSESEYWTSLRHADLEPIDPYTFDEARFLVKDVNGSTNTTVHELLRRELHISGDRVGLNLRQAFLRDGGVDPIEVFDEDYDDAGHVVTETPTQYVLAQTGAVIDDVLDNVFYEKVEAK